MCFGSNSVQQPLLGKTVINCFVNEAVLKLKVGQISKSPKHSHNITVWSSDILRTNTSVFLFIYTYTHKLYLHTHSVAILAQWWFFFSVSMNESHNPCIELYWYVSPYKPKLKYLEQHNWDCRNNLLNIPIITFS